MNKPYRVGRSSISGLGLFATKPIRKGARIIRYFGPLLDEKKGKLPPSRYLFGIDDQWTIDGSGRDNLARYINHACEPNAEVDTRIKRKIIVICAIRDIEPGEEIYIHYGREYCAQYLNPCKCVKCVKERIENEERIEKTQLHFLRFPPKRPTPLPLRRFEVKLN